MPIAQITAISLPLSASILLSCILMSALVARQKLDHAQ
jgi:hypothetical protein